MTYTAKSEQISNFLLHQFLVAFYSPIALVEDTLEHKTATGLTAKGHRIVRSDVVGISQAISYDANNKEFTGAHDPRRPGKARGQ